MKLLLIFLGALLPFTMAAKCGDHPKVSEIKNFLDGLEDEIDPTLYSEIQTAFSDYKNGDGNTAWTWAVAGESNQCTGFGAGTASCCTDNFAKHFKTILGGYVKQERKREQPTQKEFLKEFGMQLGKCKGKEEVDNLLALPAISTFLDGMKQCRQQTQESQINFLRRNFCTLCFSGDEIPTKFDSNEKLMVSDASLTAYDTSVLSDFNCYENLSQGLFDALKIFYDQLTFTDNETIACNRFADWGYNIFYSAEGADLLKPTKPATGDCKAKAKMFEKGCEQNFEENQFGPGEAKGPKGPNGQGGLPGTGRPEETAQQDSQVSGDSQVSVASQTSGGANRLLVDDETDYVVDASGYEVYIDENTLDGDIVTSAFVDDEQIDLDTSTITIEQDPTDEDATDSSNRLSIMYAVIIVILGALL